MKTLLHHTLWLGQSLSHRSFRKALKDPRRAQEAVLQRILKANRNCATGKRHYFSEINSAAEFQRRLPLSNYEALRADIARMRQGESDLIFSGQAALFEPSGGSTGGPKLIPYQSRLQSEFMAGIAPWIYDLYSRYPGLRSGTHYWSISPPGASDEGFATDASYLGVWEMLASRIFAVPAAVARIRDMDAWRNETLRWLLAAKDLSFISVWNPSFLSLLLERLPDFDWRKTWPKLQLISCWADAHAALSLPGLKALFPGVEIQPKGLIATEAFVTLPFEGMFPLALHSHFFEFVDEGGKVKAAWELEDGGSYRALVTTAGGLYRYQLGDRVRVDGFLQATPSLHFLGKEDCVSDLYGEKLEEAFVASALKKIYKNSGLNPEFSVLAPEELAGRFSYVLYIEGQTPAALGARLEEELCKNFHYRHCRSLGQLQAARIMPLPPKSGGLFLKRRALESGRIGSLKPLALAAKFGLEA